MDTNFILCIGIAFIVGCLAGLLIEFFATNYQIRALEKENRLLELKFKEAKTHPKPQIIEINDNRITTKDYFKPF